MRKALPLILLALLFAGQYSAQTKRIRHRSHNGSNASFHFGYPDNFGNPYPDEYWLKLNDSIATVDSLQKVGVYPYYFQGGQFGREVLKHWGRMILDSTANRKALNPKDLPKP